MSDLEIEQVVVIVHYQSKFHWYRSDRDLWVLDIDKWRNEFSSYGYEVPDIQNSYRFGIRTVDKETTHKFLDCMKDFEIHKDKLSIELAKRYTSARSWWDVKDLFPIMFVDFDNCKVGAFYPDGTPMERYVPNGWVGEFVDFAIEYPEEVFPTEEKFWVKGDSNLLKLLNERGTTT